MDLNVCGSGQLGVEMKKYLSFFRLRFIMGLQYRTAAAAGIVTQFFWGAMEILAFRAFYEADAAAFPMPFEAVVTYVWLQQAFLAMFAAWGMEGEIFDVIRNGNIAYELCRPVGIYQMWFARSAANRVSRALLRCVPILAVASLLPYGLGLPASPAHGVLFLLTLLLGLLVMVAFTMLVYITTFYTLSPEGVRIFCVSAVEFFAGAVIPLPFFPEKVQYVLELLPFAAMQNVPLRVYSGSMTGQEMLRAVCLQVFWLAVLTGVGWNLCRRAERRVTVQGG